MKNIFLKSVKLKASILFSALLFVLISCGGGDSGPSAPSNPPAGNLPEVPDESFETLVWSDEFDVDGSPDAEK